MRAGLLSELSGYWKADIHRARPINTISGCHTPSIFFKPGAWLVNWTPFGMQVDISGLFHLECGYDNF
jgi:hypothetical protein